VWERKSEEEFEWDAWCDSVTAATTGAGGARKREGETRTCIEVRVGG
jgi:hypothetical protein